MRPVFLFVTASLLVACAGSASGYHPERFGDGYSDVRLEADKFRVTFKGNIRSRQSETDEMALLHAAEVTKHNGFLFFVSSGAAPVGTAISAGTNVVGSPASTLTITCFKVMPDTVFTVYTADLVLQTFGPKYFPRTE